MNKASKQNKPLCKTAFSLAVILMLMSSVSCADSTNTHSEQTKLQWYPGLNLGINLETELPSVTRDDLVKQLDAKWYSPVLTENRDTEQKSLSVQNCRDFFKAAQLKLVPPDSEVVPYMGIGMMCFALDTVLNGQNAKKTYFHDFVLDKTIVDQLPANFALIISSTRSEEILKNKNIISWRQADEITSINVDGKVANVSSKGDNQRLEWLARGDFNSDGIEDLLLLLNSWVEGGSYGAASLFIVSKHSEQSRIYIVKEFTAF